MNKKLPILLLVFFLFFAGSAFASHPFTTVAVENHGVWQWGRVPNHEYTFPSGSELVIAEEFDFDLDDPDERYMEIKYLGTIYKLDFRRSSVGGARTTIRVSRFSNPNDWQTWQKTVDLPWGTDESNKYVSFTEECGLYLEANWETLAFETDISVEKIGIKKSELDRVRNNYVRSYGSELINSLSSVMQTANARFRTVEKNLDFVAGQGYRVYAKPELFDEEDYSGKTKAIVLTENGLIRYIIVMPEQWSTEFHVYKPNSGQNIKVTDVRSFERLISLMEGSMEKIPVETIDYDTFEQVVAGLSAAIAPTVVVGGLAKAGVIGYTTYIVGGTIAAGVSTATIVATGGTIIIVAGATYMAIEGVRTNFNAADGREIMFNWDKEYWRWDNEAKMNFIVWKDIPKNPLYISKVIQNGKELGSFSSAAESQSVVLEEKNGKFFIHSANLMPEVPAYVFDKSVCPTYVPKDEKEYIGSFTPSTTTDTSDDSSASYNNWFINDEDGSEVSGNEVPFTICQYLPTGVVVGDTIMLKASGEKPATIRSSGTRATTTATSSSDFFIWQVIQDTVLQEFKAPGGDKTVELSSREKPFKIYFKNFNTTVPITIAKGKFCPADKMGVMGIATTTGLVEAPFTVELIQSLFSGTSSVDLVACQYLDGDKVLKDSITLNAPSPGWLGLKITDFPEDVKSKINYPETLKTIELFSDKAKTKKVPSFRKKLGDNVVYIKTDELKVGANLNYYMKIVPSDEHGNKLDSGTIEIKITNLEANELEDPK